MTVGGFSTSFGVVVSSTCFTSSSFSLVVSASFQGSKLMKGIAGDAQCTTGFLDLKYEQNSCTLIGMLTITCTDYNRCIHCRFYFESQRLSRQDVAVVTNQTSETCLANLFQLFFVCSCTKRMLFETCWVLN